jgi:hypothetical protein
MDQEIDRLIVSVRADTSAFARDVAAMRGELEGPLAQGVGRAGRLIDQILGKALTTGKFGFDDLKRVALDAMNQIAQASLRGLFRQTASSSDGLGGLVSSGLTSLLSGLIGAPGRSTGGPVSGGRAYRVGENGPEWFVPESAGRIERGGGGGSRDVKVSISINGNGGDEPQLLRQSSSQIARAVKSALGRP